MDPIGEPVDGLVELRGIVEKPKREEAPSNLAVSGRYLFPPQIFDALDRIEPGAGGELQLTDAIALLLKEQPVYGAICTFGRYDVGQKIDFLQGERRARARPRRSRPGVRDVPEGPRAATRARVISLEDARAHILAAVEPLTPRIVRRDEARGLVLAEAVVAAEAVPPFANTGMDGYAVRAADTAAAPVRLRVVGELAAGRAPTRSGRGR